MKRCSIVSCNTFICPKQRSLSHHTKPSAISFHKFPQNPSIREAWISACGHRPDWCPYANSTICSKHFEPSSYRITAQKKRLLPNSIPKLFIHGIQKENCTEKKDNQNESNKSTIQVRKDLVYEFNEDALQPAEPYMPRSKGMIIDAQLWDSFEEKIQSIKIEENASSNTSDVSDENGDGDNDVVDKDNDVFNNEVFNNDTDDNYDNMSDTETNRVNNYNYVFNNDADYNDDMFDTGINKNNDNNDVYNSHVFNNDDISDTETNNAQERNTTDTDTASEHSFINVYPGLNLEALSTMCRLCLRGRGDHDMTASTGGEETLAEMLSDCYAINLSCMSEVGRSRLACSQCAEILKVASALKRQVLLAEQLFTQYCREAHANTIIDVPVINSTREFLYQWLCIINEHSYSKFVPKNIRAEHTIGATELSLKKGVEMQFGKRKRKISALGNCKDSAVANTNAAAFENVGAATFKNSDATNTDVDGVAVSIEELITKALNPLPSRTADTKVKFVVVERRKKSTFENNGAATVAKSNAANSSVDAVTNPIDDVIVKAMSAIVSTTSNTKVQRVRTRSSRKSNFEYIGATTNKNSNAANSSVHAVADTIDDVIANTVMTKSNKQEQWFGSHSRRKSTFEDNDSATITNTDIAYTSAHMDTKNSGSTFQNSAFSVTTTNTGTSENIGAAANTNTKAVDFEEIIDDIIILNKRAPRVVNSIFSNAIGATVSNNYPDTFENAFASMNAKASPDPPIHRIDAKDIHTNTHIVANASATSVSNCNIATSENTNVTTYVNTKTTSINTSSADFENSYALTAVNTKKKRKRRRRSCYFNLFKKKKPKKNYTRQNSEGDPIKNTLNENSPIISNVHTIDAQSFDMLPNDENVDTQMTDNLEIHQNYVNPFDMQENSTNNFNMVSNDEKTDSLMSILRHNMNDINMLENEENTDLHVNGNTHIHTDNSVYRNNSNNFYLANDESIDLHMNVNIEVLTNDSIDFSTHKNNTNCYETVEGNENTDTQFTNNAHTNSAISNNDSIFSDEIQNDHLYSEKDMYVYNKVIDMEANDNKYLHVFPNDAKSSDMFTNDTENVIPLIKDIKSNANFLVNNVPIKYETVIKQEYEEIEIKDEFESYRNKFEYYFL